MEAMKACLMEHYLSAWLLLCSRLVYTMNQADNFAIAVKFQSGLVTEHRLHNDNGAITCKFSSTTKRKELAGEKSLQSLYAKTPYFQDAKGGQPVSALSSIEAYVGSSQVYFNNPASTITLSLMATYLLSALSQAQTESIGQIFALNAVLVTCFGYTQTINAFLFHWPHAALLLSSRLAAEINR